MLIVFAIATISQDPDLQTLLRTIVLPNCNYALLGLVLIFDVLICLFYISYLWMVRSDGLDVLKLKILVYYGVASFFVMQAVGITTVIAPSEANVTVDNLPSWYTSMYIQDRGPLVYFALQLAMKLSLYIEELNHKEANKGKVTKARQISNAQNKLLSTTGSQSHGQSQSQSQTRGGTNESIA
ncbi:hypothetical protein HDU79_004617 [Rhizoclosmatium sp. JEL0117]|nr:hypothetical protein HDU79_004617 [Rhizoclosmatium sp. JEL0117]